MDSRTSDEGIVQANHSYAGYNYQIAVSAWLAVDLMLGSQKITSLEIEPRSHEDLEIYLKDGTLLTVQVKTRSTGPWGSADFSRVLEGKTGAVGSDPASAGAGRRGPAPRARPLDLLGRDLHRRFVFITDAAVESGLQAFLAKTVHDRSTGTQLPTSLRKSIAPDQAVSLASRISILEKLTSEMIENRTEQVLRVYGGVPLGRCAACRTAVVDAVRSRLERKASSHFGSDELAAILAAHEGSPSARARAAEYVEPRSYPAIEKMLSSRNAVIVTGPPGTGKTMTADVIEERLRSKGLGYAVIGKDAGFDVIAHWMRSPEPVLFHLRDPWGEISVSPDAGPWCEFLTKELPHARSDKKFLITTRSDLLHDAIGKEGSLLAYAVPIEPEDYDDDSRARIYDMRLGALQGQANRLARDSRNRALSALRTPFELDRFFVNLTDASKRIARVDHLIRDSQTEAIAGVVRRQVLGQGSAEGAVACATVIWALISSIPNLTEDHVGQVRRRMQALDVTFVEEVESFLERMVRSKNLGRAAGLITFSHPQIERGFLNAMGERRSRAEAMLNLVIRALVDMDADDVERPEGWGADAANALRLKVAGNETLKIEPASSVGQELARRLEKRLMAAHGAEFASKLDELATLGGRSPLARFAKRLRTRRGKPRSFSYGWTIPEDAMEQAATFGADERCREVARRMITDVLPSSPLPYPVQMADFLLAVAPDSGPAFLEALSKETLAYLDATNLRVLVRGALAASNANLDPVLDLFLKARRELEKDAESREETYRLAREGVFDAGYAEHVLSEAGSEEHVVDVGLREVAATVRRTEGWQRLRSHPRAGELARAWCDAARSAPLAEMQEADALLDVARNDDERASVYHLIASVPISEAADRVGSEFTKPGSSPEIRAALLAAFAAVHGNQWNEALHRLAASSRLDDARLVEIAVDLSLAAEDRGTEFPRPSPKDVLVGLLQELSAPLREIVTRPELTSINTVTAGPMTLSASATSLALSVLRNVARDVGVKVVASLSPDDMPRDLLMAYAASDDTEVAVAAVDALARCGPTETSALRDLLTHRRMSVRERVLHWLVPRTTDTDDRLGVIKLASQDESALVRLAFCRCMVSCPWPEARDALALLLRDRRDFRDHPSYAYERDQEEHDVARMAANALAAQPRLEEAHLNALRKAAVKTNGDDEAAFVALRVIEGRADPGTATWLLSLAKGQEPRVGDDRWHVDRANEALLALARLGDRGLLLDRAEAEDLVVLATSATDDLMGAAFLAMATQLSASRLLEVEGGLHGDQRHLLLLLAMLTRTTEDREAHLSCRVPGGTFPDELAAAIHSDRAASDAVAGRVAACCTSVTGRDWFNRLGTGGAGAELRWLLPNFGVFDVKVEAPRRGNSPLEQLRDHSRDDDPD